jgi:PadR family transcriptional regulator, regulatory protein PadR
MGLHLRISAATLHVLDALLEHPAQWRHGYSVSQQTEIPSGTLYPILMRLEKLAWLETRWEPSDKAGRPPRHLYRLTGSGRALAVEELRAARSKKIWTPIYSEL